MTNFVKTEENQIISYMHCGMCLQERPEGISPADWQDLEFGFTEKGMQIWCRRHDCNLLHVDYEGAQHPAVTQP